MREEAVKSLPDKTLLRPDEVAEFFDLSVKTIYNWVEAGVLKGSNPKGRSLRIFRQSVIDAIAQGMK